MSKRSSSCRRAVSRPATLLGDTPAFGVIANLYTLRSRTNWGVGDFSDLASLAAWAGDGRRGLRRRESAARAAQPRRRRQSVQPGQPPVSQSVYIDVARVPELGDAPELRERLDVAGIRRRARGAARVAGGALRAGDGGEGHGARRAASRVSSSAFAARATRATAPIEQYVARARAERSTRFATWMAIAEQRANVRTGGRGRRSCAIRRATPCARFARDAREARRLSSLGCSSRPIASSARRADARARRECASGCIRISRSAASPRGADAWAFADLFVRGVSVGAPPDPYAATGQNWGLPPLDPRALRRDRYRYFIDLHPQRLSARGRAAHRSRDGTVPPVLDSRRHDRRATARTSRIRRDDLLGILALESVRHRALVVGEDLGTVPDDVPPALAKWGVLSSKVLYFEREWHGGFKPAEQLSGALARDREHARHADARRILGGARHRRCAARSGSSPNDDEEARARDERDRDRGASAAPARSGTDLAAGRGRRSSSAELRAAVHGFLWSTPAQLVGLSLDDLAGEVEPVNVPGVGPDRFPSWTRKMRADLETITTSDERCTSLVSGDGSRRSSGR